MRLHSLQHVPFEDLAHIESWAQERSHSVSRTLLFNNEPFPEMSEFDWLVILGGPMNIYEEEEFPWLKREKKFIAEAIARQKVVLGICLGAQLVADVLGGKVFKNLHKEIGWYPVRLTPGARESSIFRLLPAEFVAFHWHGDTFSIPPGGIRIAESEGCPNQAFEYHGRVIGLQFHLESALESIQRLIRNCEGELVDGKYIQSAEEMLAQRGNLPGIKRIMTLLLDHWEKKFGENFN